MDLPDLEVKAAPGIPAWEGDKRSGPRQVLRQPDIQIHRLQ